MYLALRNQAVTRRSVIDTMRVFKEMGYGGMELSLVRGLTDILAVDYLDDYVIDKINEVSAELSFPITALACHQNYVTCDFTFDVVKRMLKTAPKYNTDIVIVSTFVPDEVKEKHPELYDTLAVRTKELCNVAEENDVKLAIEVEPHQLFHNLRRFFEVVDKVKSPALKLNFDVGHIFLSEVDLIKAIDDAKDFIVYSHIENMVMGEHAHKLPWDGDIDLLAVYRKMKETCYDGPVSLDLYLQDYEEVAPKCLEYINNEIFSKL